MPRGSEAAQSEGYESKYQESENGVKDRPIKGEAELVSQFEHTDYSGRSGMTPEQRLNAMSNDVNKIVSLRADAAKKQQQEDDAGFWEAEKEKEAAADGTSPRGSKVDLKEGDVSEASSVKSLEKDVKGSRGVEKDTAIRQPQKDNSAPKDNIGSKTKEADVKKNDSKPKDDSSSSSSKIQNADLKSSDSKPKDKLASSELPKDNLSPKQQSGKSKFRRTNADVSDDDHPSERVSRMDRDSAPKRDALNKPAAEPKEIERPKAEDSSDVEQRAKLAKKNALRDSFDLDEPVSMVDTLLIQDHERLMGERVSLDRTLEQRRPEIGWAATDPDNNLRANQDKTTFTDHFSELGHRLRADLHLGGSQPEAPKPIAQKQTTFSIDNPRSVPAGKNPSFVPATGSTAAEQRTFHGDKPGHAERVARVADKHPQLQKDYKRMGGADMETALPLADKEVLSRSGAAQDHADAAKSDDRIAHIKSRVQGEFRELEGDVESGLEKVEHKLVEIKDSISAKLHLGKERVELEKDRAALKLEQGVDKAEWKIDQAKERVSRDWEAGKERASSKWEVTKDRAQLEKDRLAARWDSSKNVAERDVTLIKDRAVLEKDRLSDKVSSGWEETKELVAGGLDVVETKLESLEHSIEAGLHSAKNAVVDLKDDGLKLVHKAGDKIADGIDSAKQVVVSGVDKTKDAASNLSSKAKEEVRELKRDVKQEAASVRGKFSNQKGDAQDPLSKMQTERDETWGRERSSSSPSSSGGLFSRLTSWWSSSPSSTRARDSPLASPSDAGLRDDGLSVSRGSLRGGGKWERDNAANYSVTQDPDMMQRKIDELAASTSSPTLTDSIKEKVNEWSSSSSIRSPISRSPSPSLSPSRSPKHVDVLPLARDEVDYRSTSPGLDSNSWGSSSPRSPRSPTMQVRSASPVVGARGSSPVDFDEVMFNSAVEPW